MPTNTKAAEPRGGVGGQRTMQISDWRPSEKGTRRAFFTLRLSSGLVIRNCVYHQQGDKRWIQMHAERWQNALGYTQIVDFATAEVRARFQAQALAAVDAHLDAQEATR